MKFNRKCSKLFLLILGLFLLSGMLVFIGSDININPYGLENNNFANKEILTEPKSSWTYSTQDIRPNGDISNNGFKTIPDSGSLYEKIDEVSADDADYIYVYDTGYDCEVAMGNLNLDTGQTVTGIKVYIRGNMLISGGEQWDASIDWRIGTGSYSTAYSVQFEVLTWGWRSIDLWGVLDLSESQINNIIIRISIIGDSADQTLAISTMYAEITIRSNENPNVNLTSPIGGEILQETTNITWTCDDPEGQSITFDLFYDLAGTENWNPIVSGLVNDISYEWDLSGFTQTQDQVRVKIKASDGYGGTDEDISDTYFTIFINHDPVVNLTSPNGGEILQGSHLITWNYTDIDGDTLTFNLSYNIAGGGWSPIVSGLVNETSYEWDLNGFTQRYNEVLIKLEVSDEYNGLDEDISNGYFEIFVNHDPSVNLLSPDGTEIFQGSVLITWTYADLDGDTLTFNLSYNIADTGWISIVTGLVNETSYEWDVSEFTLRYDKVKIKVEVHDGYRGYNEDASEGYFIIKPLEQLPDFGFFAPVLILGASVGVSAIFIGISITKRKRKKSDDAKTRIVPKELSQQNVNKRKIIIEADILIKKSGNEDNNDLISNLLFNNTNLLNEISGKEGYEVIKILGKFNITTLSDDFLEKIEQLDLENNEKEDFIKDMLGLPPNCREQFIDDMLRQFKRG